MKRIISTVLVLSMLLVSSVVSAGAVSAQTSDPELRFDGHTEYVVVDDKSVSYNSYAVGTSRFVLVTEDGLSTLIEFDDTSGAIYVDGRNIVSHMDTVNGIALQDNWGPERSEVTKTDIVGLSVSVVAALIVGYYSGWNGAAMDIAQIVVSEGIPALYFKTITQYNYVDYSPKVGYRLTEELHKGPACNSSTLLLRRTMNGSR